MIRPTIPPHMMARSAARRTAAGFAGMDPATTHAARAGGRKVRILTRTGLDWTHKYPAIAAAVSSLAARQAYLDGELCGVGPDGVTSFSMIQNASDTGNAAGLAFFLFDLLYLDDDDLSARSLIERK